MLRKCKYCGKEFKIYPSQVKRKCGKFCSRSCFTKARAEAKVKRKVKCVCKTCGKEFEVRLSAKARGEGIYCSVVCRGLGRRMRMAHVCENCNKEFIVRPSEVKRGGRFCSNKCRAAFMVGPMNPRWKGGSIDKGGYKIIYVNGKQIRQHRYIVEQYLKRPLTEKEIVHHIDGDPANNNIENLQVMTQAEHVLLHLKDDSKRNIFTCPICGKNFEELWSRVKTKEPCCSMVCARVLLHSKTHGFFTCPTCGKEFERRFTDIKNEAPCCSCSCAATARNRKSKCIT